ncbi:hypothetical protein [Micromonospora sp. WMMD737]|uniref:hypothetical protein n=1 Tax=Micromonospora sp. WMMD737 TaxID=3404113 RepID=UPI003B93B640
MKAHRTDIVSFAFGLIFLGLAAWWLLAQLLGLALPPVGWFLAGALILIGLLGLLGALRSGRSGGAPAPGDAPSDAARTGATASDAVAPDTVAPVSTPPGADPAGRATDRQATGIDPTRWDLDRPAPADEPTAWGGRRSDWGEPTDWGTRSEWDVSAPTTGAPTTAGRPPGGQTAEVPTTGGQTAEVPSTGGATTETPSTGGPGTGGLRAGDEADEWPTEAVTDVRPEAVEDRAADEDALSRRTDGPPAGGEHPRG